MSAAELMNVIGKVGKKGVWKKAGLRVSVTVVDVRPGMFGRTDMLIEPEAGDGRQWVDSRNVEIPE